MVTHLPDFFPTHEADELLQDLLHGLDWSQEAALLFGRRVPLPRLTAWFGPTNYRYSGVVHSACPFPPVIQRVARSIARVAGDFDCALANLYRSGQDSVSWHSDSEPLWGAQPTIVSVSFGATRTFCMRHRVTGERIRVELNHGSVLVMQGKTQQAWLHSIAKTRRPVADRVNLSFRRSIGVPS